MKKLFLTIILLSSVFASINYSNAYNEQNYSQGYIDKILDLRVGIEEYDLSLGRINQMYFSNNKVQALFNEYRKSIELVNEEIIKKYRNKDFSYYQVNGIISNQKMFTFHINKFFENLQLKNRYPNDISLDDQILENYSTARTYYKRLQYLVNK